MKVTAFKCTIQRFLVNLSSYATSTINRFQMFLSLQEDPFCPFIVHPHSRPQATANLPYVPIDLPFLNSSYNVSLLRI